MTSMKAPNWGFRMNSQMSFHGTRPLTSAEWQGLLEAEGFSVQTQAQAPMHLLEPWRIIQDEGVFGALRFALNLLCYREGRRRVLAMRRVFSKYRDHLAAVMMVAQKKEIVESVASLHGN